MYWQYIYSVEINFPNISCVNKGNKSMNIQCQQNLTKYTIKFSFYSYLYNKHDNILSKSTLNGVIFTPFVIFHPSILANDFAPFRICPHSIMTDSLSNQHSS